MVKIVFSHTTNGATNRSSIVRGDVAFISGTWNGGGDASGTVVTGGSTILAYGVEVGSVTVTNTGSAMLVLSNKNNPLPGSIKITKMTPTGPGISGDWWAITRI